MIYYQCVITTSPYFSVYTLDRHFQGCGMNYKKGNRLCQDTQNGQQ